MYQQTPHKIQFAHRIRFGLLLCGQLVIAVACCRSADGAGLREMNRMATVDDTQLTAIVGGRLWDGQGGIAVEPAAIVVQGSKILAAGPLDAVTIPAGAHRVDARGMTVLPGLIDSHLHTVNDLEMPALVLRHGVTAFRDPGHPLRFYQALLQTDQTMPRAFLTGSHLDAYPPIWPQQAIIVKDARPRQILGQSAC